MKALVTGGAGFIGSHLVDSLLERGDQVAIVDDLSGGSRANIAGALESGAEFHLVDITDPEATRQVFDSFRPDATFHLAAQMDVRRSVSDPAFDATVNVAGTVNVLHCSRLSQSGKFVFVSTGGAIYGDGLELPLDEDTDTRPMSPYGQSKLAGEGYVGLFQRVYGVDGVTLRLGNVYGPRQDPNGEGGVVAIFSGKIRDGDRPVVFGNGNQTRDFVHVVDVVTALLSAAASDATGPFNIGTGEETSVLNLIELMKAICGDAGLEPILAPAREGEIDRIAIDPSRAAEELGWRATTDLDTGLRSTIDYVSTVSESHA